MWDNSTAPPNTPTGDVRADCLRHLGLLVYYIILYTHTHIYTYKFYGINIYIYMKATKTLIKYIIMHHKN